MHAQNSEHSAKRIWTERAVFAAIIVGIGIWTAVSRLQSAPSTIVVDGKPIVSVESRSAAKKALIDVRLQRAIGVPAGSVRFAQQVTLRTAPKDAELAELPEAVRALQEVVTVEAELFAITANGKPVVAFTLKEDAEQTLSLVKRYYEDKIRNLHAESTFKEKVLIEKRYVDVQTFCASTEEAVRTLTSTAEKPMIHVVQWGDRAAKLAQRYVVPLAELKKLNPDMDLNRISEGDELLIRRAAAPVTVISKVLVTKTVAVTRPRAVIRYRGARVGKRVTKTLITYENGEQVGEEIISQVTTWEKASSTGTQRPGE